MKNLFWEIYRKLNNLPKMVRIEACSLCQLNCVDCYMRKDTANNTVIKNGYLKAEDFKNFIKRNGYIKYVELSLSGEIFLNPELIEIIKYAYENNIFLTAFNGVNFNSVSENVIEALVKYKFGGLAISIDGATQETYEQYRRNGNLEKVINNIKKLNEYKEKYNSEFPIINWQYIVFEYNINEINQAIELAKELKFSMLYTKKEWNSNEYNDGIEKVFQLTQRSPQAQKIININNIDICQQPYLQPQINWDGMLLGCCCSIYNDLNINVFKSSLAKALKSKKMQFMRNVLEGKEKPDNSIDCYKCKLYKGKRNIN